jgi:cobalamin biosynthesis protein CobD/CbiB
MFDFADHPLTWFGAAAALLAALAWLGDWHRQRRKDPDAVGWVPWVGLFFAALFVALVLLALGIREWF